MPGDVKDLNCRGRFRVDKMDVRGPVIPRRISQAHRFIYNFFSVELSVLWERWIWKVGEGLAVG